MDLRKLQQLMDAALIGRVLLAESATSRLEAFSGNALFQEWEDEDLNNEELKYYMEVNSRVMQMLVDVIG